MLPLWIIDLQQDGVRSKKLQDLIGSLGAGDKALSVAGKYWFYTRYPDIHERPDWFRDFLDSIVEDGFRFVELLRQNDPVNDPCVNICVLGDASEIFSLLIFSAVAAVIKKEKPLIFSDHVQQGINVLGMLYVPSDVNTLPYLKRQSVLRCMSELQVQRKVNRAGGYDKVMLYQDTQHRTEKFYPLLTPEQQAEYVFQCLVHLYYVCDSLHPLLDGSNANDDFYFSMGVGSLFYDTSVQDDIDEVEVGNRLVERFKVKGSADSDLSEYSILDRSITPRSLLSGLRFHPTSIPDPRAMVEDCETHPVNNFTSLLLKKRFYVEYLQHYVEDYQKQVIRKVAQSGQDQLLKVNEMMAEMQEMIRLNIESNIPQLIRCSSEEVGALSLIDSKLGELEKEITVYKSDLKGQIETSIWQKVEDSLPRYFRDAYREYHEAFRSDREKATDHPACDEKKQEKLKELTAHLKKDATILSRIARAFIAGIVSVLAFMPVLETISPRLVNLGDVAHHPFFYAFTLFLLPAIIEAIRFYRYHRKRKRFENEIVAYYLHDSYARLANRMHNKVNQLYDYVVQLVEKYRERCNRIRNDHDFFERSNKQNLKLPETTFNLSVIGGKCCNRDLFTDDQQNHNILQIDVDRVRIGKLNSTQEYYLINKFSEQFAELFKDPPVQSVVSLDEENTALETRMYMAAKKAFQDRMKADIQKLFVKREDSTVGDKLDLYRRSAKNTRGFDVFCRFNATNGEFTANDNESFADVKSNSPRMKFVFGPFLPIKTTFQVTDTDDASNPTSELFKKYLFLTRWRTFNFITASRVLPEIDLEDRDFGIKYGFDVAEDGSYLESKPVASLVLFSIMGNLSGEWYSLFDSEYMERLQTRLYGRKPWKELEEAGTVLEEGTIPYYDKILDPKVD